MSIIFDTSSIKLILFDIRGNLLSTLIHFSPITMRGDGSEDLRQLCIKNKESIKEFLNNGCSGNLKLYSDLSHKTIIEIIVNDITDYINIIIMNDNVKSDNLIKNNSDNINVIKTHLLFMISDLYYI